jgi:hypothetical protein
MKNRSNVDDVDWFLEQACELSKKHNVSVETVIEAKKVLELEWRNTIEFEKHLSNKPKCVV